jgi:hypothetical protein
MSNAKPWVPPIYDEQTMRAFQAVGAGIANADQQKIMIRHLMELTACYDLSFRPDEHGGERASAFAEGKRFVGLQIRKMLDLPVGQVFNQSKR